MQGRRRRWPVRLVVAAAVATTFWVTSGVPAPAPTPAGSFVFAALGDAPYYPWEVLKFRLVLRAMDSHELSWVLHVGDIFWRPCTDDHYRTTLDRFNSLRHPVIYSPGDNEWSDCWEPGSGGFAPGERLASLRRIFFADPHHSLGTRRLALATQSDNPAFREFVEHQRWSQAGITFATVHLVGSGNAMQTFPARTAADDDEARRRTEAAAVWLRETFAEAAASGASAVVIAFHGALGFGLSNDHVERRVFEPFTEALEEEVARFSKPVVAVHGDQHEFIVDSPLVRRATGVRLANFTRVEVPGSPDVGWVRVVVTPANAEPFAFQPLVVPRWKYW